MYVAIHIEKILAMHSITHWQCIGNPCRELTTYIIWYMVLMNTKKYLSSWDPNDVDLGSALFKYCIYPRGCTKGVLFRTSMYKLYVQETYCFLRPMFELNLLLFGLWSRSSSPSPHSCTPIFILGRLAFQVAVGLVSWKLKPTEGSATSRTLGQRHFDNGDNNVGDGNLLLTQPPPFEQPAADLKSLINCPLPRHI